MDSARVDHEPRAHGLTRASIEKVGESLRVFHYFDVAGESLAVWLAELVRSDRPSSTGRSDRNLAKKRWVRSV